MVQRLHPKSRKGFNLIEAAIVLGVVGLVIGGIWVASSTVMRKHRAQQTLDGYLFISERLNQTFGRTAMTSNCGGGVCGIQITNQQLQAMLGTPPAGWTFNADGTLDSPIFSDFTVFVKSSNNGDEDSNIIGIDSSWPPTKPVNEADCKVFGILALKSLASKKITFMDLEATVVGGYAGGELAHGAFDWWASSGSGNGLPDPLLAAQIDGCDWAEIDIARP